MTQRPTTGARADRLDRSSALPLWAQLRADLQRRVDVSEFTNAPFPGELALSVDYAVSRHTVREALRQLRSDGVLVAERGRPPRLAAEVSIDQPLGALYSLFASVEAAGLPQRSIVRALDIRQDPAAAGHLGLTRDTDLLYLERVRLAGNEPLAIDSAWLPADLAAPLLEADFTHTALYIELAARCGIRLTGGKEQLRAVIATPEQRRLLGIDAQTAVLSIDRLGCLHGRPAELRHTTVRGDHFTVTAQFSTSTGYRFSPGPFRGPQHRSGADGHQPGRSTPARHRHQKEHPMTTAPITDVDPATAQQLISDGKATLVDVREDDEWAAGHAPHATHTPLGELDQAAFRPDQELIAVCRTGSRSGKATDRLRAAGLTVHNLTGGMRAWDAAGLPVRRDDGTPGAVA